MTYGTDMRLFVLKLHYVYNQTCFSIQEQIGISRRTIHNWKKLYEDINFTTHTKKSELKAIDEKYKNHYKDKLTVDKSVIEYIKNYTINNNKFNVYKLMNNLAQIYDIHVSKSTIYNWLHKINLTYKKARKKIINNEENVHRRKKYVKTQLDKNTKNKRPIHCLDECSMHINEIKSYGWNLKGEKVDFQINNKKERYSILSLINKRKIHYTIKKGSINSNILIEFLKENVGFNKRITILMDNAAIHKSKEFWEFIKQTKIEVLYNAPYNPEGNPIEHLFGKIKTYIKAKNNSTKKKLFKHINHAISLVTNKDLQNFYKKSFSTFT